MTTTPRRARLLLPVLAMLAGTAPFAVPAAESAASSDSPVAAPAASAPATAPPAALRSTTVVAPDGVPLHVVEAGLPDGPPVLLLHGYSQGAYSWLPQLQDPGLARRYRLVALDLRGHGASGKPWTPEAYAGSRPWAADLHAVVTGLKLDRPVVVGWSFGGYVAMDYLREHGTDALAGLVLVGSHGGLLARPDATPARPSTDPRVQLAQARQFMAWMSAHPLLDEPRELGVAAVLMLPPYAREAMTAKRLDNRDLAARLPHGRVLAILGAADPSVPAAPLSELLAAHGGRLVSYEGVGHSPFVEAAARFGADLAEFVEAVRAGPRRSGEAPWVRGVPVPDAVRAYIGGLNAGDPARSVAAFADDGAMYLTEGRVARGREALFAIERFHAVVRPHVAPRGLSARRYGERVVVAMTSNVERSPMFEAMGLARVRTLGTGDAFVVAGDRLESARQPEFEPACRRVMGAAMGEVRRWLEARADVRLAILLPGGRLRMDADTAPVWLEALREWRAATGWSPDDGDRDECVRDTETRPAVDAARPPTGGDSKTQRGGRR